MTAVLDGFDHVVDVLIVGSGGGGMSAALTAQAAGLDALVIEKSSHFGGSTALSGGGIWVPGAPAQRREGYVPSPEAVTMAAASWVMADPARYGAAQTASRAGRLLRRHGRISALPPPLAAWTTARDAPVPPRQTFRHWWRDQGRP